MQSAIFTNFSPEEFTGYWDGRGKTFKPGQSMYMPDYLAKHFAKHLTNRELLRKDKNGNPLYKDGEKMTSPKRMEDNPLFMELFNKAYKPDDIEDIGNEKDDVNALIDSANKNREMSVNIPEKLKERESVEKTPAQKAAETRARNKAKKAQDPNEPQIVLPPDADEDEFEGEPKD